MESGSSHGGEMSQVSLMSDVHRTPVTNATASSRRADGRADPAARTGKKLYEGLNSSSVGLELGLSVLIGFVIGYFLDDYFGTTPWLMLLWIGFGLAAGFRGVMRAIAKEDKRGARDAEAAKERGDG